MIPNSDAKTISAQNVLTHILLPMHVNDFAYGFVAHEINMNLFPFKIFGKHFVRLNAVQQHLCTVKYHLLITLPFYTCDKVVNALSMISA